MVQVNKKRTRWAGVKSQWDLPDNIFLVVKAARGINKLARACGINRRTILRWRRVPEHHLDAIYLLTGLHPIELRPDVFDPERMKKKAEFGGGNKEAGPRRRRYKHRKTKISKQDADIAWLI